MTLSTLVASRLFLAGVTAPLPSQGRTLLRCKASTWSPPATSTGDGILDLIASTYFDPGGTTILLGVGDGTFTVAANQLSTDRFASSLLVGDFNGDGKLDIAIGYSSGVGIYLGAGDGTFNQVSGSPFTGTGVSLVAGDFNHDGLLDLVGVNQYGLQLDLLLWVWATGHSLRLRRSLSPVRVPAARSSLRLPISTRTGVPDLELLSNNQGTATALLSEPTETATATIHGIAPVGIGTHNVAASYPGDSNYSAAASASVALTAGTRAGGDLAGRRNLLLGSDRLP